MIESVTNSSFSMNRNAEHSTPSGEQADPCGNTSTSPPRPPRGTAPAAAAPANKSSSSSSSSCSSSTSQIMQIAQMIQQKAETLLAERQKLQDLQLHVQRLQQEYDTQCDVNDTVKYNLLKRLKGQHDFEMRQIQQRRQNKTKRQTIEMLTCRINRLTEEKEIWRERNKWQDDHFYSPHLAKMEIYQRSLQGIIQDLRSEQEARQQELQSCYSNQSKNLDQVNRLRGECEKLQHDIEYMKEMEIKEDEEIASIAAQIRATVAKRASLRNSITSAKERNIKAHEVMVKWEQEYMNLAKKQKH